MHRSESTSSIEFHETTPSCWQQGSFNATQHGCFDIRLKCMECDMLFEGGGGGGGGGLFVVQTRLCYSVVRYLTY